jgi:Flp pilus assembly protein TadD
MRLGRLADARNAFMQAEKNLPLNEDSLLANIRALEEHEEFVASASSVESLVEEVDTASSARNSEALVTTETAVGLAESGDLVAALSLFRAAVKLVPSNGFFLENLGVTEVWTKN